MSYTSFSSPNRADFCSTASSSQYDYYQHDHDESLEGMTSTTRSTRPEEATILPSTRPPPVMIKAPTGPAVITTPTPTGQALAMITTPIRPSAVACSPSFSRIPTPIPTRSLSSPSCSIPFQTLPQSAEARYPCPFSSASWSASRGSPFQIKEDSNSRIPRRIHGVSSETCGSSKKLTPGGTGMKGRNLFTVSNNTPDVSTQPTVATNGLIINSGLLGGGDAVNLHPEVEQWLDIIPLSKKPFRNFHRDFADGVVVAEIMAFCAPKKVDLHNYVPASAFSNKKNNWSTLNQKVFSKIGVKLTDAMVDGITQAKPGFIEKALRQIYRAVEHLDRRQSITRARELSALAASFNGTTLEPPFVEEFCLVRTIPGEIPDCVIYQNIKYFPSTAFEDVAKNEELLREKNNDLCTKVHRLETLVSLKESHLQDLTAKVLELRRKYEGADSCDFGNDDSS